MGVGGSRRGSRGTCSLEPVQGEGVVGRSDRLVVEVEGGNRQLRGILLYNLNLLKNEEENIKEIQ